MCLAVSFLARISLNDYYFRFFYAGVSKYMTALLKKIFILPVRFYQIFLSPMMGQKCRYDPTCSHYMIGAINEWGPLKGLYLGIQRIFRCHPWSTRPHFDPVPRKTK